MANRIGGLGGYKKQTFDLAEAIQDLTTEQAVLVMSTQKVSAVQARDALIKNGVAKETAENVVTNSALAASQTTATGTTTSLSSAFKGLAASVGISTTALGAIVGAIAVLGVATIAISAYNKAKEEVRETSVELTNTYKQEKKSLDAQIEKYQELKESLDAGNLSTAETHSVKEQLLAIQQSLIDSYGSEASKLDLVNGKYAEQLGLLSDLSKEKATKYVNENRGAFSDAKKALNKERTYSLGYVMQWNGDIDDQNQKLYDFLDNYSEFFDLGKNTVTSRGFTASTVSLAVKADVETAHDLLHQFAVDLEQFGKKNNINVSGILEGVSGQLSGIWTEELEEYKDIYDEFIKAEIVRDDALRPLYKDSISAVEEYNKALSSGEGVSEALIKINNLKAAVESATQGNIEYRDAWESIWGSINSANEEKYNLKTRLSNDGGLMQYISQLKDLYAVDLRGMNFTDGVTVQEAAFHNLLGVLGYTKENAEIVIAVLEELGLILSKPINTENGIVSSFTISEDEAKALDDYQSKIDSISSSLADLHNLKASDITSLLTDFSAYADIWEQFGVNEYGEGDIEGALEAIAKKLKEETTNKVPQMRSYIEGMYEAVLNPKGDSDKLQLEVDSLELILKDVRDGKVLDESAAAKLINKYPELADAVKIVAEGYSFEEEAIKSLTNSKITEANESIAWEIEQTEQAIEATKARIEARNLELASIEEQNTQRRMLQGQSALLTQKEAQAVLFDENGLMQSSDLKLIKYEKELQGLLDYLQELKETWNENIEAINKNKELEEAAKKFASIRDILETELNGSISDNRRLEIYKALEPAIIDDYNAQIAIAEAEGDKLAITKLELEKKQALADLDQQRIDLARELDDAEISRLEKIRTELQNQIDLNGGKGTAEQYSKLISNERSIAAELTADLERENKLLIEIESTLGKNSTAYREQEQKVNDIADGIAECEKNTKEWGKEILNLAIDAINDSIDGLNKKLEQNQNAQDEMDSIIAGAVAYIQDEIDAQEELKQGIQDQIDALQEANDERERALALEKAKYELERAMSQRTVKVYKGEGKGFVYEQDREAVRDAQENLSNLEFEATIHALEKQIEYYDDIIEDLQEIQDAWSNVKSDAEDYLNIQKALEAIGVEGIFDTAKVEEYSMAMRGLLETEQQINDEIKTWQAFLAAVEEISSKHTYNALSMEEAIDAIQKAGDEFLPKLEEFKSLSEDGTPDTEKMANVIEEIKRAYLEGYSEMVDGAEGAGDDTKGVLSKVVQAAIDDNDAIESDTKSTYEAITQKLKDEVLLQREELEQLKTDMTTLFGDMYKGVNDGLLTSLGVFSDSVSASCSLLEAQISALETKLNDTEKAVDELIEKETKISTSKGGGRTTDVVAIQKFHTGLEKGLVGEKQSGEGLKKVALRKLEPDEVPAVLKVNEAVLTQLQQQNVMSNIGTAFRAGVNTSVIKNNSSTPVVQNINLTLPNVTNESGYNRLVQELQGLQLDALQFAKRR